MGILERMKERIKLIFFIEEREKKELVTYREKIAKYKSLEADVLEIKRINLKTEYETKKNNLSVFVISIFVSIVMGMWGNFYSWLNNIYQNVYMGQGSEAEIAYYSYAISVYTITVVIVLFTMTLGAIIRDMRQVHKELLIIENVLMKNRRRSWCY